MRKDNLTIWLVTIGEPLPIDSSGSERLYRHGLLANYLVQRGHKVIWWTSDFYHQKKKNRYGYDKVIHLNNNYEIRLLHSIPYKKNISIKRIINHIHIAKKFKRYSMKVPLPDLVLASYPTIELSLEAVKYGIKNKIPVIVDFRDNWPDIFLEVIPDPLKSIASLVLRSFYRWAEFTFKNAYAIIAITDEFLKIALNKGKRRKKEVDKCFPYGYEKPVLQKEEEIRALTRLKKMGISVEKFIICFFGTIGYQFDFDIIIEAANILKNRDKDILFVICGLGEKLKELKAKAPSNMIFSGWLSRAEIWTLMKFSKIAIAPYINREDFLSTLSNKMIEYLAGELPILSSIEGEIGKLIKTYNCGIIYGNSVKLLTEQILWLKNNPNLLNKMSQNAKRVFDNRFSADRVYPEMVEYLEEVVKNFRDLKNG